MFELYIIASFITYSFLIIYIKIEFGFVKVEDLVFGIIASALPIFGQVVVVCLIATKLFKYDLDKKVF